MLRRVPPATLALVAAALAVGVPPAFGHAAFEGSTPPPGRRIEAGPDRIVLRFTESLNGKLSQATLREVGGARVPARESVSGSQIVIGPTRPLGRGAYRVEWRTVSTDDAHPLEGAFGFGVRTAPGAGAGSVQQSPLAGGGWARALARGLLYAALLLFAGGLLSRALLGRRWPAPAADPGPPSFPLPGSGEPGRDVTPSPNGSGAGASPVATLAPPREGMSPSGAPSPEPALARADALVVDAGLAAAALAAVAAVVDSAQAAGGLSVSALRDYLLAGLPGLARVALVGVLLVAVALARRSPRAAGVAGLAALGCIVAAGHANSASPRGVAILADWAHLAGGAVWLGGAALLVLVWGRSLVEPGGRRALAREVLPRFGRIAVPAFGLVVVAGVVNAVIEVGPPADLWRTSYGLVLLVKIALVAATATAAYMHVRLRRRGDTGADAQRRGWRALRTEVALGVGIAAAAGLLVAFPLPPRQLEAAASSRAAIPACDPCPLPAARAGELAVARQAGSLVVAGWIRRAPGRLVGTLRTLDVRGRPAPGPILVPGGRTTPCGVGCARFELAPPADVVRATVTDRGRDYVAALPARWRAGEGAAAVRLLARAERTMRALRSVREDEVVTSGPGTRAVTHYALRAPNRLAYATDRGVQAVQVGGRQWLRAPGLPWSVSPVPGGLPFLTRTWFRWTPYARTTELLGVHREGGQLVAEVVAADPATPVWFSLSIDERSGRVLREELVAQARLIRHRFFGFNAPVSIVPPRGAVNGG